MTIGERTFGPVTVLRPGGALDMEGSPAFGERLDQSLSGRGGAAPLAVVDFSDVPFISSAGLRVIMIGAKRARAGGGSLAVAALNPTVREIFEISKFHHVVPVFPGVREAIASMSEDGAKAFDDAGA